MCRISAHKLNSILFFSNYYFIQRNLTSNWKHFSIKWKKIAFQWFGVRLARTFVCAFSWHISFASSMFVGSIAFFFGIPNIQHFRDSLNLRWLHLGMSYIYKFYLKIGISLKFFKAKTYTGWSFIRKSSLARWTKQNSYDSHNHWHGPHTLMWTFHRRFLCFCRFHSDLIFQHWMAAGLFLDEIILCISIFICLDDISLKF